MSQIHPTAVVDPSAVIADDVIIGPYVVIEGDVHIGPGCRIGPATKIGPYTTLGRNNVVDHHACIGGLPQDLGFDPATPTYVRIGDNNVFREGVTISRATAEGQATVIGNDTYWMANAHAGHDVHISNRVLLGNGAMIGGHARVDDDVVFSNHTAVHQFCWIGKGAYFEGLGATSMHVPPYCVQTEVNKVVGLNEVGLERSPDITEKDLEEVKLAFSLLYHQGLTPTIALAEMYACSDWGQPARGFREFVRKALDSEGRQHRGICPFIPVENRAAKYTAGDELDEIRERLGI